MVTKNELVHALIARSVALDQMQIEDLQAIVYGVLNIIDQEHGGEEILAETILTWIAGRTLNSAGSEG